MSTQSNPEHTPAQILQWILGICVIIWIIYAATNFRFPLSPITLSDQNSGAAFRQLIFGCAGMTAFGLLFFTRNLNIITTSNLPITLLAGFLCSSVFWSDIPLLTLKRSILFLLCLITVYTIIHRSSRPTEEMLKIIIRTTTGIAITSLILYFVFPKALSVNPARPGLAGVSVHPNTLAPFLSIGLLLTLAPVTNTGWQTLRLRSAQAILGIALLLTLSMTTLITTILGIALYCYLVSDAYRKGILQIITFSTIMLISIIGWTNIKSEIFTATGRDESLSGRDSLWAMVINEGKSNSVFGKGFGAFWTEGKGRELVQTWNPRQSHNAYIDVWLDLGFIGIISVLFCFPFTLFKRWYTVKGSDKSPQRKAIAALYATAISYMLIYAFAQSFFLRFDSFPFLALAWITLIINNSGSNKIEAEFINTIPLKK